MSMGGDLSTPSMINRVKNAFERLTARRDDTFSAHKILGLSCLISFLVRFAMIGERDMGFDNSIWTPLTILLHFLLSTSSMLFRLPRTRVPGMLAGGGIWPEYRYHSITFASRSLACMTLTYIWNTQGIEDGVLTYAASTAVVLLNCAAADLGSRAVGKENQSRSVRDLKIDPILRFFFSYIQIFGTMLCLMGLRRYSVQFVMVFILQFTAFLMTLMRKDMVSHNGVIAVYAMMLIVGSVVGLTEVMRIRQQFWCFWSFGNTAAILRIGVGLNKYVLWGLVGIMLHFAVPMSESPIWLWGAGVTTLSVLGAARHRIVNTDTYRSKYENYNYKTNGASQNGAKEE